MRSVTAFTKGDSTDNISNTLHQTIRGIKRFFVLVFHELYQFLGLCWDSFFDQRSIWDILAQGCCEQFAVEFPARAIVTERNIFTACIGIKNVA